MDIFKYFGIDVEKDTLAQTLGKMNEAGLRNACIIPRDKESNPTGMILLLSDPEAVPYVEKALEQFNRDSEGEQSL